MISDTPLSLEDIATLQGEGFTIDIPEIDTEYITSTKAIDLPFDLFNLLSIISKNQDLDLYLNIKALPHHITKSIKLLIEKGYLVEFTKYNQKSRYGSFKILDTVHNRYKSGYITPYYPNGVKMLCTVTRVSDRQKILLEGFFKHTNEFYSSASFKLSEAFALPEYWENHLLLTTLKIDYSASLLTEIGILKITEL